jgi:ketosteroid isomerase-like protein
VTAHARAEVEEVVARYCDVRRRIDAGELPWGSLAQFFTDDCVYIDPAWGRVEGIGPVSAFFEESMRGLEDWQFPIEFAAISGDNVVVKWIQVLPGTREDGTPYQQSGSSTMVYAGDGKFSYQEDLLNMVHVLEDLRASKWRPGPGFASPPEQPDRNFARPS